MNTGWICPRCGKVHSPYVLQCDCKPEVYTTVSVNTSYFGYDENAISSMGVCNTNVNTTQMICD